MSRISLKFDTEILRTTKKTFILYIFTVASLLLDYFVKSRLNLSTNGADGVLRDAVPPSRKARFRAGTSSLFDELAVDLGSAEQPDNLTR